MKTIAMCALLAALAFGLLPGNRDEAAAPDEGLVLLVETQQDAQAPQKASSARQNQSEKAAVQTAPDAQTVRLLDGGAVTALSMEDYLTGVLLSEMPADFEPEARKAQAVAARTFTCRKLLQPKHENADVCAEASCCQAWTSREQLRQKYGASFDAVWSAAREAVRQTAGQVLTYDGQLIDAVYFSCSGGATEAAVAVWGTDVPYLQAVESPGEEAAPRFSSRAVFSPEEFSQRLMQENPDVQLSGSPDAWLGETTRSAGGGAVTCSIGGVSFSGTQLRRMFGLNSTRLTLSYQDGDFVFDVTGFGHRVGMSQYGAQTMARLGFSYQTILQYYYQGAEVERQ